MQWVKLNIVIMDYFKLSMLPGKHKSEDISKNSSAALRMGIKIKYECLVAFASLSFWLIK